MRIAIDVRSLMEGRHSGVEEYTTNIIRGLIRVAPQHNYHLFYNSARAITLPDFGEGRVAIAGRRFPNKLFNTSQLLLNWPKWDTLIMKERVTRPGPPRRAPAGLPKRSGGARPGQDPRLSPLDVVFVPNPRLVPLSPAVPLVAVFHDLSFELLPEFLTLRKRLWHKFMRPRYLAHNADHIIAVSEHTKQDLVDLYGVSAENISVIHSGIPATMPRAAHVEQLRKRLNLPQRFVLYLGTLEPRKNVASIIRAWSAIAAYVEHDLVIAGERGWREGEVEQAIAESLYKKRIHQVGFIAEADKPALYAAADVFVYPSFYEGFGFPPLEALLAGTPVITSFNSALPEVVGQWATLIDPYNTSQLAGVLKELLTDPQRIPVATRQEIQQQYSWDKAAKQTIQVLESVA